MDIPVGQQPVALLFAPDGSRLYVANSGSNTVSVIDTTTHAVRENIRTSLFPKSPTGSTPNALALAPDGKRLFVTNADNNDVAVIDVSTEESKVVGFIPTGWYPTTVAVAPDGKRLFVGVGKGLGSKPSFPRVGGGVGLNIYNKPGQSYGPQHDQVVTFDYICSLLSGSISIIDMPDDRQLARYTAQVIAGCPYRDEWLTQTAEHGPACLAAPRLPDAKDSKPGLAAVANQKSKIGTLPIQHVLYIIKENRTYDQIFGDMKEGNGDPDLVLFGENVTPNHHALAREFVLLDNLYCNGEVSEDGHQWCNAAFCTDWTQKVYPGNYATPVARRRARQRSGHRLDRRLPVGQLRAARPHLPHLRRVHLLPLRQGQPACRDLRLAQSARPCQSGLGAGGAAGQTPGLSAGGCVSGGADGGGEDGRVAELHGDEPGRGPYGRA